LKSADTITGQPKTDTTKTTTSYKTDSRYVSSLVDAKNGSFSLADIQASQEDIEATLGPDAYENLLDAAIAYKTKPASTSSGLTIN
jgi:hypothetical protein